MSEPTERPPSHIPVPWPFRPRMSWSLPILCITTSRASVSVSVDGRVSRRGCGMMSGRMLIANTCEIERGIGGLSIIVKMTLLRLCLHSTINANTNNLRQILAVAVNAGFIVARATRETVRVVNGWRFRSRWCIRRPISMGLRREIRFIGRI